MRQPDNWPRDKIGNIDLVEAYKLKFGHCPKRALRYLRDIHGAHPIRSRQAATVAIATAYHMTHLEQVVSNYVA
jgi:hypothetical protein